MAKRSIMGVVTGKLGNMVGQKNALVTGADKQVWRVYKGDVKNPKTIKQAQQRALFVAVKNFAQALSGILDHSWQGVDYGTKSLNHFRKLVLSNKGVNYPGYIIQEKGSQDAVPQSFPLSTGNIPFYDGIDWTEGSTIAVLGFNYVDITATTVGAYWTQFLADNPSFKNGDMITVVAFIGSGYTPDVYSEIYPVYDRFIIDTESTVAITGNHPISQKGIFQLTSDSIGSTNYICVSHATDADNIIVAAGVIISRQKGTKAQWQRSTSKMYVTNEYRNWVMTADYITAVLDSYMNSVSDAESDWYLNETGENTDDTTANTVDIVRSRNMPLSNGNTSAQAYFSKGRQNGYLYRGAASDRSFFTLNGMTIQEVKLASGVTANTTDLINIDSVADVIEANNFLIRNISDIPTDSLPE